MLDRNQPYGEVSGKIEGAPGARYFQDGLYFNGAGEKVGGEFVKTPVKVVEKAPAPEAITVGIVAHKEDTDPVIDENGNADDVNLEDLSWQALKKMVVAAGGEYAGKPEAIAFLSAK